MEIKVNDYVRTRQGYIAKIENETDDSYWCDDTVEYIYEPSPFIFKDKANEIIIKSSPNIIDLIEVGDYVNGEYVTYINKKDNYVDVGYDDAILRAKDIKSIVTKEMYSNVEYRVENN